MQTFNILQIVIGLAMIAVLLFQVRGGGLGGIFGQPDTVYRTRRGMARTLFRITLVLAGVFVIISLVALKF